MHQRYKTPGEENKKERRKDISENKTKEVQRTDKKGRQEITFIVRHFPSGTSTGDSKVAI